MTDYKNVDENFAQIMSPNSAYCTFKKDVAFHHVLKECYETHRVLGAECEHNEA